MTTAETSKMNIYQKLVKAKILIRNMKLEAEETMVIGGKERQYIVLGQMLKAVLTAEETYNFLRTERIVPELDRRQTNGVGMYIKEAKYINLDNKEDFITVEYTVIVNPQKLEMISSDTIKAESMARRGEMHAMFSFGDKGDDVIGSKNEETPKETIKLDRGTSTVDPNTVINTNTNKQHTTINDTPGLTMQDFLTISNRLPDAEKTAFIKDLNEAHGCKTLAEFFANKGTYYEAGMLRLGRVYDK